MKKTLLSFMVSLFILNTFAQQPINDNCNNASIISINNLGFAIGTFQSDTINIANATMQAGEAVPPSIFVAGQNQKSIWFRFTMSTNRQLRVTLKQIGTAITAGDVGFSVYKTNSCLPTTQDLSTKLTPMEGFGSSYHGCVDSGEYLIQVSSKLATIGLVFLELEINPTLAPYDERDSAYQFGVLNDPRKGIVYSIGQCHSKESANESCINSTFNLSGYTKTTWHTFKTPAFFDYISMLVASGNNPYFTTSTESHVIGYKIYKGDARTTALSSLIPVYGCDTLQTTGIVPAYKTFYCSDLDTSTTYSLQLFFKNDFDASIRVGFFKEGTAPAKAPIAMSSQMDNDNKLGILSIGSYNKTDFLSCNSRHENNACGNTKTTSGIVRNGVHYNLSTYFSFKLTQTVDLEIIASTPLGTTNCQNKYIRIFKDSVSNNCSSLDTLMLYDEFLSNKTLTCVPEGNYTIQVLGSDTKSNIYYNDIQSSTSSSCFYSNFGQEFELTLNVNNSLLINHFPLNFLGALDSINNMLPLAFNSFYLSTIDTFGCSNTVLPFNSVCDTTYTKAMYREFVVADSGLMNITNLSSYFTSSNNTTQYYKYMLFQGDANALASAQSAWNYPNTFSGLIPYSNCFQYNSNPKICIVPDTYTLATFGNDYFKGKTDQPTFNFTKLSTHHYSQSTVENMGSILDSLALTSSNSITSGLDTFSCISNAVIINGYAPCNNATKAIYREFYLSQSSIVKIVNSYSGTLALFTGQLSTAGFNGISNIWACFNNQSSNYCAPLGAGWYTVVSYGSGSSYDNPYPNGILSAGDVGYANSITITIMDAPTTSYFNPATTENLGSIVDSINNINGGAILSNIDTFSCLDNAVTIDGVVPCNAATKAIYREFYLSQPGFLQIVNLQSRNTMLFSGQLSTSGLGGLTNVWACFTNQSTSACELMPVGWYTVVSYGYGFGSSNPPVNTNSPNYDVNLPDQIKIIISYDCASPKFNRPYKAAVDSTAGNPFLVQWNISADTGAYPLTRMEYELPTEYFNCTVDTPFSSHPITACDASYNRVAYYVFELTQESYLNFSTGNTFASIYKADVRTDSMLFGSSIPLQPCMQNDGRIEICKAQPGVYTLVIFANAKCTFVTPKIYIDKVGYSRFDHAINAYDFGVVATDNIFHNGKTGDLNPLHPLRAPSNDFFYCTTGAQQSDPNSGACNSIYNSNIYNQPDSNNVLYPNNTTNTNIARRNLWYTFQIDKPGWVSVKVDNKTIGKMDQLRFVVYESDVDGSISFSQVINTSALDSTLNQGLVQIAANFTNSSGNCNASNDATFFIPPCNYTQKRYYVLVDNRNAANPNNTGYNNMKPNHQLEVSIKVDSTTLPSTLYDYYSTAGNIGTIGIGNVFGPEDNFSCATTTPPYPVSIPSCAQKTIWYKFTVANNVAGVLKIGLWLDSVGINNSTQANQTRLFQEIIPGDSTNNGLQELVTNEVITSSRYWQQTCISSGTYYLLLTGCYRQNERVFPELDIEESPGDYCNAPQVATVTGSGTSSSTVIINCHTIGTDYGEFAPTLSCPTNGITNEYKTSWFRIDINGNDTLDLTTFLVNNTNAPSSQIQYRMMTGNCNAMQEQSCVMDILTQNTYQCMLPGSSYYIQVFVPKYYQNNNLDYPTTGSITLNINSINHMDTCAPVSNCITNANFIPEFNCATSDSAIFVNFSTYGNNISYLWDFGFNNEFSTLVSPKFRYPALNVPVTYTVKLRVVNSGCSDTTFSIQTITIPPRPEVNLGNDTVICTNGSNLLLDATFYPGSTYIWGNTSSSPTQLISNSGNNLAFVSVTYAGCTASDSINVFINPIVKQPIDTLYICSTQDTVLLNSVSNITGVSYHWSNNASTSSINVNNPGWYWSDIMLNGCIVTDSFLVILKNVDYAPLGIDTAICSFSSGFTLNATAPGVTSYFWSNNSINPQITPTSTGLYWVNVMIDGCMYSDSIEISALPIIVNNVFDTICFEGNFLLPSNVYVNTTGIYQDTFVTTNGCDSAVVTNLYVRDSVKVILSDTICSSELPFIWNGMSIANGGINASSLTISNVNGCDSTTILNLTVHPTNGSLLTDSICVSELPFTFSGHIFTQGGSVFDTFQNVNFCDSIVQITLTVFPIYSDTLYTSICMGDTFVFNNNNYTQSGNYLNHLVSQFNCDSTVLLSLIVNPIKVNNVSDTICYGSSYTLPSNQVVNLAGVYFDTLSVINSCDSVIITNLFIRDSVSSVFYDTICSDALPYIWNGISVNTGGGNAAMYMSPNASGCDSVTFLNLLVNPVSSFSFNDTVCSSELPYDFMGNLVTTSGVYTHVLPNYLGCDSTISLHLEVMPLYQDTIIQGICDGEVFLYDNVDYNNSGFYTHHFSTIWGCDSTVVLNLIVYPIPLAPIVTDTLVYCVGTPANVLNAVGINLKWYQQINGGVGSAIAPIPTTFVAGYQKYYVSQTINGCESPRAEIVVLINEKPIISFTAQPDVLCEGEQTLITFTDDLPDGFLLNWDWQEESRVQSFPDTFSITWNTYGQKQIKLWITNPTCVSDTVLQEVNVIQRPGLPIINLPDYACIGDSIILSGAYSENNLSFYWEGIYNLPNDQASYNLSWDSSGMKYFSLYTYNQYCKSPVVKDSVWISKYPDASIVTDIREVCQNDTIVLKAKESVSGSQYLWTPQYYFPSGFPNDLNQVEGIALKPGYFHLNVTNQYGCSSDDSIYITTIHCCLLFVPNAFSPNNDGINDKFELKGELMQTIKRFIIYNRFGQVVFSSNKQEISWDGTVDNKNADPGVYFYQLFYMCSNGVETFKKGEIHLIR